jgi:hypothetical protein
MGGTETYGKYDAGIATKDSERFLAEFCQISMEIKVEPAL